MRDSPLTPSAVSDAVREASWTVRDGMGERLVMELAQGSADAPAASLRYIRALVWAVRPRDQATRRTMLEIYRRLRGAGRPLDLMAAVDGPLWEEIGRELVLAVRAGRLVARPAEARVLVVQQEATEERALGPDSTTRHIYTVCVRDDTGAPVAGAKLTLDIAGDKQDKTTDGSGQVTVEKSVSDTATVTLNNREELVDKLWRQWAQPLAHKAPPGDQITQAVVTSQLIAPFKAPADWLVTLVLTRPPIWRVRMVGMIFDGDKCFLLPQALDGIKSVVAMHQAHPAAKVLIVGHEGGDEVQGSVDLALGRAKILADYLTSKPDDWMTWFGSDKSDRQRWGVREVQLMLSALPGPGGLPFYDGSSPGVMDDRTVAAIKAFQTANGLTADGKPSSDTRAALVKQYMAIEDTSLAAGVEPVAHGCTGHEDDTMTQDGLQPDDRRLEVLFFDTDIKPAPSGDTSDGTSPEYPAWRARLVQTVDFENHGMHVQIVDEQKQPVPLSQVHLDGPAAQDTTSDEHGFVTFWGMLPGEYKVSGVSRTGIPIPQTKIKYPTAKTILGARVVESDGKAGPSGGGSSSDSGAPGDRSSSSAGGAI